MTEPLISVILPVYNMEKYLSRCLDSVLNNTYRNLEVLCIDDGSQDSSPGHCHYEGKRGSVLSQKCRTEAGNGRIRLFC